MNNLIPDQWKSKRQVIVETYIRTGSIPATAEALYGNRDVSYVRTIIVQWKRYAMGRDFVQPIRRSEEQI